MPKSFRSRPDGTKYPIGSDGLSAPLPAIKKAPGYWSGTEYSDNGYGFYFNYDVQIPDDDGEIQLDGMTEGEVEEKIEELTKKIGLETVDAFHRSEEMGDDYEATEDDQFLLDNADTTDLSDLQYLEQLHELFDYWGTMGPDELEASKLKHYSAQGKWINKPPPFQLTEEYKRNWEKQFNIGQWKSTGDSGTKEEIERAVVNMTRYPRGFEYDVMEYRAVPVSEKEKEERRAMNLQPLGDYRLEERTARVDWDKFVQHVREREEREAREAEGE